MIGWFSYIDIARVLHWLRCILRHIRELVGLFRLVLIDVHFPIFSEIWVKILSFVPGTTVVALLIIVVGVAVALTVALCITVAFVVAFIPVPLVIVARVALVIFIALVRHAVALVITGLGAWSTKEGGCGRILLQSVAVKCRCISHLLRCQAFVKFPDHVPVRFRTVSLDMICSH